jgi:hypothetical protein
MTSLDSEIPSSHTRLHSNGPILAQKDLKSRVALDLRYTVGNAGYSVGHAAGAIWCVSGAHIISTMARKLRSKRRPRHPR